jgi:hypothetical protein
MGRHLSLKPLPAAPTQAKNSLNVTIPVELLESNRFYKPVLDRNLRLLADNVYGPCFGAGFDSKYLEQSLTGFN